MGASCEDAALPSHEPQASIMILPDDGIPLDLLTRNEWSAFGPVACQEDSAGPGLCHQDSPVASISSLSRPMGSVRADTQESF